MKEIIITIITSLTTIIVTLVGAYFGYRKMVGTKIEETRDHTEKIYHIVNNGKLQKAMDRIEIVEQEVGILKVKSDMIIDLLKK